MVNNDKNVAIAKPLRIATSFHTSISISGEKKVRFTSSYIQNRKNNETTILKHFPATYLFNTRKENSTGKKVKNSLFLSNSQYIEITNATAKGTAKMAKPSP